MSTQLFYLFEIIVKIVALNSIALVGFLHSIYGNIVKNIIRFQPVTNDFTHSNFPNQIKDETSFFVSSLIIMVVIVNIFNVSST